MAASMDRALSQPEWQAVSVALSDSSKCGCAVIDKPSALRCLYRALTGTDGPRPLADPRLEAVRGFVCETNRHGSVADRYIPVLLDHGFNDRQVNALALLSV